jgi:hypothetical protein
MGKRGPKPVDLGKLSVWEFEFYKAFHLLRDGIALPPKHAAPTGLGFPEIHVLIRRLEEMSPEEYWLASKQFAAKLGDPVNLKRPPCPTDLIWAEQERKREIDELKRELKAPSIEARSARHKIWTDLVKADTYAALRKVCGRWAQLPDVRRAGMTPFPRHVLENASQFLSMKRNNRFPRSNFGDDARMEYLARGMAGVLCGVSAMTGIERLRNMSHDQDGPFWVTRQGDYVLPRSEQYCRCWRCSIRNTNEILKKTQTWYENGLRLFMNLAAAVKTPREWAAMRSKHR